MILSPQYVMSESLGASCGRAVPSAMSVPPTYVWAMVETSVPLPVFTSFTPPVMFTVPAVSVCPSGTSTINSPAARSASYFKAPAVNVPEPALARNCLPILS